jgi:cysteine synthase
MEKQLRGELTPGEDILVWPSTGNYGIGGSFVGPRMGYQSLVLLPEMMSQERFEKIKYYGADYIKTPGCESNVKEIYDKCHELRRTDPRYKILNQFEVIGNYLFHYYVTGNSAIEVIRDLQKQGIGNGRCAGITSSMGSSGTIGFGDRVKQEFYETRIIGLEPIQCPTMYSNGYGGHDIQGIGDKHVTWIHNCMNMDALMCIDDMECKKGLQLLSDPVGVEYLVKEAHVPEAKAKEMSVLFGISGICNLLGAIKAAKFYQLGAKDTIVTIATDSIDRYYSVMKQLDQEFGAMDEVKAAVRLESIFHQVKEDYVQEATKINRERWFNLKYYTWVEQQGKTVQELNAQKSQDWWLEKQTMIPEIDQLNRQKRGF